MITHLQLKSAPARAPSLTSSPALTGRSPRLSASSFDDPEKMEKKIRGFQHIIQDLSAENAEMKEKYSMAMEEISLLKEVS